MVGVRVRWFDADERLVAWMLCPGLHTAEARLDHPAPPGAVMVRIDCGARSATYAIDPGGHVRREPEEDAAE